MGKDKKKKPFTILFQGDSVTDCNRTFLVANKFPPDTLGEGYPFFVAARLWNEYPAQELNILNRGISGHRVVDLYARWKIDCLNLKPDVLSILIGVNDTWHGFYEQENGVELDRYERIYREMIQWTLTELPEVKIVLMEPFIMSFGKNKPVPKKGIKDVAERGKIVKKLAKEFNLTFIPCQSILNQALDKAGAEHWLADGVHPTIAGHQLLADAWIAETKKLLPKK